MASDNGDMNVKNDESEGSRYDPKTLQYLEELLKEKHVLTTSTHPHASRLIEQEVSRTKQTGYAARDFRYMDILREKAIKVTAKVMIPIKEYPKFNFVGKLLGPKGNTLKRLQEVTLCKMCIFGRGSMKDKNKEEELRNTLDPKYSHLSDDLHVEISALASPSEAHARLSYALKELRKYLIPDSNDDISQSQLLEMENYGEIIEEPVPYHLRGTKQIRPNLSSSKAKVMSILEKARNSMESMNYRAPPPHRQQNNFDRSAPSRNMQPQAVPYVNKSRQSVLKKVLQRGPKPPHRQHQNEYELSLRIKPSPGQDFDCQHPGYDGYSESYDQPQYEEGSRNQWGGGGKMMSSATSRFMPRPPPYSRP